MSIVISLMFIIAPFLSIPLIILGLIRDRKHSKVYIVLLALLIAIISYSFNPKSTQDLYKYNYIMDREYSFLNFGQYLQIMFDNNKFLFEFLKYIISQIGNYRLLPFICVFIGFLIVFYTIFDYSKIKNISVYKSLFIMLTFVCILNFLDFTSGLAQILAIIITMFAFYLEYIKGKKKWYYKLLYVLPGFIHASMFIAIILRILLNFDLKKYIKFAIPILIFYGMAGNFIAFIISPLEFIPIIGTLISKAGMYLVERPACWDSTYGIALMLLNIFYFAIFLITSKQNKEKEKFDELILLIILFNISSIQYYDICLRFSTFAMILMNIYLLKVLSYNIKKYNYIIFGVMLAFSIAFGSVNYNSIASGDFNNIWNNLYQNLFYFFKVN